MNLAELKNVGAFIPAEPVKVPVEWKGYTFDVWVKRLSFGDVESLFAADDRSRSARMIAAALLLGENKEPISYEDAYRLDVSLASKLIEAFNSVNGVQPGN
ncbi:phage tail assembly chaperone family protein, TAC [Thauera humireducens]|jgi:hypothetical protein|uniref:Phage tail assembly protein n=1 Tax=Thauera humireducens TaxID=1134435 RepID=A0A127K5E2_9RHOO|nr:phage tail assembly chaperone family protein, TAC [Thauera humireducens]AMO37165.1 hypothetical protein AC731_009485 [Thauera humireducens]